MFEKKGKMEMGQYSVVRKFIFSTSFILYLAHVKNKLSTGILIPNGLFCSWIPIFEVFVWTASTLRQHTTETSVLSNNKLNWHTVQWSNFTHFFTI